MKLEEYWLRFSECIFWIGPMVIFCAFIFVVSAVRTVNIFALVLCYGVISLLSLIYVMVGVHLIKKQMKMEERFHNINAEYAFIEDGIEELSHFRHDMRHHLRVIATLNAEGRSAELADYLRRYTHVYENLEENRLCDHPLINTIIQYYTECCREENIRFQTFIQLSGRVPINPTDLTALLGNCLENAMNACLYLPNEKRFIRMDIVQIRGMMLIYVENSSTKLPSSKLMMGEQSKKLRNKYGKMHGYGLDSIRRIAKKYDGTAEFLREEEKFIARVALNCFVH